MQTTTPHTRRRSWRTRGRDGFGSYPTTPTIDALDAKFDAVREATAKEVERRALVPEAKQAFDAYRHGREELLRSVVRGTASADEEAELNDTSTELSLTVAVSDAENAARIAAEHAADAAQDAARTARAHTDELRAWAEERDTELRGKAVKALESFVAAEAALRDHEAHAAWLLELARTGQPVRFRPPSPAPAAVAALRQRLRGPVERRNDYEAALEVFHAIGGINTYRHPLAATTMTPDKLGPDDLALAAGVSREVARRVIAQAWKAARDW